MMKNDRKGRNKLMLEFLVGLVIGRMLSCDDSSETQVNAFRFEQLSSSYYDTIKNYVINHKDNNKGIWWTKVKGRTLFIILYDNTFKIFHPYSGFLGFYYYLEKIGKEYKKEYKIEDDKFIVSVDEEIIELKMNYIKGSHNKLILHDIDDNSEILFKRITID